MTGFECRESFLSWLALEKRASPLTVEAYGTDLASFLGFLTSHLGAEPDLSALVGVTQSDIRAWLASLANEWNAISFAPPSSKANLPRSCHARWRETRRPKHKTFNRGLCGLLG